MQQSSTPAVTLTPAAIAYLLRNAPLAARRVKVGTTGPEIRLVVAS